MNHHHHFNRSRMKFIKVESREALDALSERYEDVIYLVPHVKEGQNTVEDRYDEYIWIVDEDLKPQPGPQPDRIRIIKQFSLVRIQHAPKPVKVDKRGHWELIGEDVVAVEQSVEHLAEVVGEGFEGATITEKVTLLDEQMTTMVEQVNTITDVIGDPIVDEEGNVVPVYNAIKDVQDKDKEQDGRLEVIEGKIEDIPVLDERVASLETKVGTGVEGITLTEIAIMNMQDIENLQGELTNEQKVREEADAELLSKIEAETAARESGDNELSERLGEEVAIINQKIEEEVTTLNGRIDTEVQTLEGKIEQEKQERTLVDGQLADAIAQSVADSISYYADEKGPITFDNLAELEELMQAGTVEKIPNRIYLVRSGSDDKHSKHDEYISMLDKRTGKFSLERIGQDTTIIEEEISEIKEKVADIDEVVQGHTEAIEKNTADIEQLSEVVEQHGEDIESLQNVVAALQSTELRMEWTDKLPATFAEAQHEGETKEQTEARLLATIFIVKATANKQVNNATEYIWNKTASSEDEMVFEKVGEIGLNLDTINKKIEDAVKTSKEYSDEQVTAEQNRAEAEEARIAAAVEAEVERAAQAEQKLSEEVAALDEAIKAEAERAVEVETALKDKDTAQDTEIEKLVNSDKAINDRIDEVNEKDDEQDSRLDDVEAKAQANEDAIAALTPVVAAAVQTIEVDATHGLAAVREDNSYTISIDKAVEAEDEESGHEVILRGENFTTGEQVEKYLKRERSIAAAAVEAEAERAKDEVEALKEAVAEKNSEQDAEIEKLVESDAAIKERIAEVNDKADEGMDKAQEALEAAAAAVQPEQLEEVKDELAEGIQANTDAIAALSSATQFKVVLNLPAEGDTHTIYLWKPEDKEYYEEWIWVLTTPQDYQWVKLCDADIKLTDFYNKAEIDSKLDDVDIKMDAVKADLTIKIEAVETEADTKVSDVIDSVTEVNKAVAINTQAIAGVSEKVGSGIHDESGKVITLTDSVLAVQGDLSDAMIQVAKNTADVSANTAAIENFKTDVEEKYAKKSDATTLAVSNDPNTVVDLSLTDGVSGHDYTMSANLKVAEFDTINNMWADADAEKPATSHQIQDFVYEEFRRKGLGDNRGINPVVVQTKEEGETKALQYSVKLAKYSEGEWDFTTQPDDYSGLENLNLATAVDVAAADTKVLADSKQYTDEQVAIVDAKLDAEITRSSEKDTEHDTEIEALDEAIKAEKERATQAENATNTKVDAIDERLKAVEEELDSIPELTAENLAELRAKDADFETKAYQFKLSGKNWQKLLDLLDSTEVTTI